MNSRSARAQIEGVCFDKEVIFKSPEPTTRVLSQGGVIEYRAYKYPYTTSTEREPKQQRTARADALMTHHPAWVGHHTGGSVNTHNTPVPSRREAVGGPTTTGTPQRQRRVQTSDPFTRLRENIVAEQKIGTTWSNDGTKVARQRVACGVSQ